MRINLMSTTAHDAATSVFRALLQALVRALGLISFGLIRLLQLG